MKFNLKKLHDKLNEYGDFRFEIIGENFYFKSEDGKNIGLTIDGRILNLNNIDLKNSSGQGIGVEILTYIIKLAKNADIVCIMVIEVNEFSKSICDKLGFYKEDGTDNMILRL